MWDPGDEICWKRQLMGVPMLLVGIPYPAKEHSRKLCSG